MKESYTEPEKQTARKEALEYAIKTLTKDRFNATIARKTYVREVWDYLKTHGSKADKAFIKNLKEKEIESWEQFYLSSVGKKKPSELKVAYLSGPNPINDLQVLVDNGILPENVWAFESDNSTYNSAVVAALESQFPYIKIYKGRIENYLKILSIRFDIIYLDFKGRIDSEKTLSVIRDLFNYQKLNSPGILITNFALPENARDTIALSANYLFPKSFTEKLTAYGGGYRESAETYGISSEEFIKKAYKNPNTFYSQFITRVLYDLPSLIVPFQRFSKNETLIKTFFKKFNLSELPEDNCEEILTFPNEHSLVWSLNNFIVDLDEFENHLTKFRNQLAIDSKGNELLKAIELMDFFSGEVNDEKYNSEKLQKISSNWKSMEKYVFCDVFLFHQLKDILIGQLTSPYYYNVAKTKRWTYIAKTNRMFMDLVTYDECRYIFDWMPTIDMFEEGVDNLNRQLTLRFAMDSIAKQRRWYNDEFFNGTAVIDQDENGFAAQVLKKRKQIN